MNIKKYDALVSPFNQSKVLTHYEDFELINKSKIIRPVMCEIDLTDGFCNNKCKHCFFGTNQKSNPIYMNTNTVKNLLNELHGLGVKAIEFSGGGEPTTHPDFSEIVIYALDLGFEVGVVSNGLLINKIKKYAKRLKFIRISLDAASNEVYKNVHGVNKFNDVIKNINLLIKQGCDNIGIAYLIVPDNVSDIVPAYDLAYKLGVSYLQYRPASLIYNVSEIIWEKANKNVKYVISINKGNPKLQVFDAGIKWGHLNKEREYKKCMTSTMVAVVQANGNIPLCVLLRNQEQFCIGNIANGGFTSNWFSQRHLDLIENKDLSECRKPCKHDSYNIMYEAFTQDYLHKNFI